MSSDIAITVKNLGKSFHIYDKPRDRLFQMLRRGHKQYYREFWALKDISFSIRKGETVGIIGRNGSGKSTLLQIICGTLTPNEGQVETNGRIAALLELGSGFNPEFTGRENVYMNGAVLGLSKREIDARFDDIIAFADIGDFIDQPVKTYSSGMQVRLAFSVAINVEPQILVVDEALSVGDELFQRKCFSRIEKIKQNGATILFVSHSGAQIVDLCDRAILLDSGDLLISGTPKNVVGKYQKLLYAPMEKHDEIRHAIISSTLVSTAPKEDLSENVISKTPKNDELESYDPSLNPQSTVSYESKGAIIECPRILTLDDKQVNTLKGGRSYRYCYQVIFDRTVTNVRFGMLIKTISGVELGGGVSANNARNSISIITAGSRVDVEFRFQCNMNSGVYFLNAGVVGMEGEEETYLHRLLDACMFRVLPEPSSISTGVVDFGCIPEVILLDTMLSE